jgi:hypothetical protein
MKNLSVKMPTEREIAESGLMRYCRDMSSPTNFPFWYNPMKDHVLTPKSEYWHLSFDDFIRMQRWAYGDNSDWDSSLPRTIAGWVNQNIRFPFFLKNGTFSGKHDWSDTCFVKSSSRIKRHLRNIFYMAECMSAPATPTIVAREFVPCDYSFTAFGGTPITTEIRLFSKEGGRVDAWQHYWSDESLEGRLTDAEWASLRGMQKKAEKHIPALIIDTENALKKSHLSQLEWSIDWLLGSSGNWYMIDMAERHKSYVSPQVEAVEIFKGEK